MGQQSKWTRAPAPREAPPPAPLLVPPPAHLLAPPAPKPAPPPHHPVNPSAFPSTQRTSTWIPPRPPQSVVTNLQQPNEPWYNIDYSDPQAWGVDSHPPGGYLSYFQNTPSPTQSMHNGSSPQPINVGDDTNGGDCGRTEKRLLWTKQEDLRLLSAWLNNSNDPIQSNYKKNEQYWKDVAAVYNSTTPKNRERLVKQVKDRFGRIKKRVAWFCASYKEANALYVSGESDADLKKRAMQTYEANHKKDGRFMFEHCWEILKKEPKWDAYLERLEDLEPDKRKFSVDDEVGKHSTIDDDEDERPPGGKQAKEKQKRKRKDEGCIIDLEDELQKFSMEGAIHPWRLWSTNDDPRSRCFP